MARTLIGRPHWRRTSSTSSSSSRRCTTIGPPPGSAGCRARSTPRPLRNTRRSSCSTVFATSLSRFAGRELPSPWRARTLHYALPRISQRYDAEFSATPGTYYIRMTIWSEKPGRYKRRRLTMGVLTSMDQDYDYMVAKYGEDNAQYLMEVLGQWHSHYSRAAYVETGLGKSGQFRSRRPAMRNNTAGVSSSSGRSRARPETFWQPSG